MDRGFLPAFRKVASYLAAAFLVAGLPSLAGAGDLNSLYTQILRDPSNVELNLQYARLAEAAGTLRWALAAYERILINDPTNTEARRGMQRVLRSLQPSFTIATLEYGVAYESNPTYYIAPKASDAIGLGSLSIRDERYLFDQRWRTAFLAAGQVRTRNDDLNYGYAGFETGPVFDIAQNWTFNPAVGAGASFFDHHFFYDEVAASGTFEGTVNGSLQVIRVRTAYRQFDDFFPSTHGTIVDVRGRFSLLNVLGERSIAFLSPFVLWSDIGGGTTTFTGLITELQPGKYVEAGAKFEVYKVLTPQVTVGANIGFSQRNYRNDIVTGTIAEKRQDTIWAPGATVVFPSLIANQSDLKLDYKYIDSHSNDVTRSFTDHVVSATVVTRFDPFAIPGKH